LAHGGWSSVLANARKARGVCDRGAPTIGLRVADERRRGLPQSLLRLTEGCRALALGRIRWVGRRLLIVDDNPVFRRLARELLEADGYEVVGVACDAREALVAAGELMPEVVLLDVNLPDASGFELAAKLAREQPAVSVLLTSTRGRPDFEQLALANGARGFVSKDNLSGAELDRLLG
jgi:CheY-like chemotaxis protein